MSEYEKLAEQLGDIAVEMHGSDYRTLIAAKELLLKLAAMQDSEMQDWHDTQQSLERSVYS
jgi:hypothetical protein